MRYCDLVIAGIIQFVVGNQAFSRVVETLLSSVENREHNRYGIMTNFFCL